MQYFGFFLVIVAVVGFAVGVVQEMKAEKILAAPFKKTGVEAQNPRSGHARG